MSKRVLFLAHLMRFGYGVSVAIDALSRELAQAGFDVTVGCMDWDGRRADNYQVQRIRGDTCDVENLISQARADVVIAHTSPFFELLPKLRTTIPRWVWEHGDPTPELFVDSGEERKRIADNKRASVYPNVERVVTISEFVRTDIGWPEATVIYNGCDHVRAVESQREPAGELRVGTLMRLGQGEGTYKGNALYLQLVDLCRRAGDHIEFSVMGRGSEEDAKEFRQHGIAVHLNASDEERAQYLADLDVFVSLSLWEGFNLPLVEAQRSATVAIALDTGAHPEVTPLIVTSLNELQSLLRSYAENRNRVSTQSQKAKNFVDERFVWARSAERMAALLVQAP